MSVDSSVKSVEKIPPEGLGSCRVSVVKSAKQVETTEHQLEDIRNWIVDGKGKFAETIKAIRATSNEEQQAELKCSLPAVMFSGTFRKRSSKELIQHSGLICMDFDKVENPEEVIDNMRFDPHLALAFVSPRGNGVKAVFCIPDESEQGGAFETTKDYCATMYDLEADESGKDLSRLCFLSVDPEAHYAPDAEPLRIAPKVESPKPKKKPTEGDRIGDRYQASIDIWDRSADLLKEAGWKIGCRGSDQTFCTRPGKERGVSGTLWNNGAFYCFSDQAAPLKPSNNYSSFALVAEFNHGGDFKAATKALALEFGDTEPGVSGRDFFGKVFDYCEDKNDSKSTRSLFDKLQAFKFNPEKLAPLKEPLLLLKDIPVLYTGNLLTLVGHDKSGKSHVEAAIAKAISEGTRHLGFTCSDVGRIAYIDYEQDRNDFESLLLRAGCNTEKVAGYHLTGQSAKDAKAALIAILEGEHNLKAVLIDGFADLLGSVNDEEQAIELVRYLMAAANKYEVAIIGVLHLNPGSDEKSRGHLGSQLGRKSQTVLQINQVKDGSRVLFTQRARKRSIPEAQGVRFDWCNESKGFVEIEGTPGEIKQANKVENFIRMLRDIEAETGMLAWKFTELKKAIETAEGVRDRTARNRIKDMLEAKLIKHDSIRGIYTSNLPTAPSENEL
jgi:hypothetical protein